jgi:heme oxygenase
MAGVEFVTSWEREGCIKSREEGQRELVERQLTRKLGPLTPELTERLSTLLSAQLVALGEALFDFATLADLEQWLDSRLPRQEAR